MSHIFALALLPMSFALAELYWQIFKDSRDAGGFVLADSPENVVTWAVPLVALIIGGLLYWRYLRREEDRPESLVLKLAALTGATLTLLLGLLLDSSQQQLGASLLIGALALADLVSPSGNKVTGCPCRGDSRVVRSCGVAATCRLFMAFLAPVTETWLAHTCKDALVENELEGWAIIRSK